ncbi:MAG: glutamate 5-kinase [Leptospiraceae bacterium]|nr:glutamate 5-kinase [Leptospiraceae bacterium]MDW8306258.1 glutamate 5-kinase [Leptospiraceae bacterium]
MEFPQEVLRSRLQETTHVVLKLGTGVLTPQIEQKNQNYFILLAQEIKKIHAMGKKVLLVSSGAVGFGRQSFKKKMELKDPLNLVQRQALASVGQVALMETYRTIFAYENLTVAQILLSRADFASRTHYRNIKNTLDQLLEWGCIPIINENDPVAISELRFGDNDTLSALIAGMYPQTLLIILTTVPGFYRNGELVTYLPALTSEELRHAKGASLGGTGGMKTKLLAAERILVAGQVMVIASGQNPAIISDLLAAKPCGSWFFNPQNVKELSDRKRYLIHQRHTEGKLVIDLGARQALEQKTASLLLVGIHEVYGDFSKNAVVDVFAQSELVARGFVSLSAKELRQLLPHKKAMRGLEVIHRDNMVLLT